MPRTVVSMLNVQADQRIPHPIIEGISTMTTNIFRKFGSARRLVLVSLGKEQDGVVGVYKNGKLASLTSSLGVFRGVGCRVKGFGDLGGLGLGFRAAKTLNFRPTWSPAMLPLHATTQSSPVSIPCLK